MITYTPNPSFSGTDSFTYRVTNPDGVAAVGTVTVTVVGGVTVGPDELTVDVNETVLFQLVLTITVSARGPLMWHGTRCLTG